MSLRGKPGAARRWLEDCSHVGEDPHLVGRPTIYVGDGQLRIGHRFRLASSPVTSHLVAGDGAVLDIGDDVCIGHGAAISAHQSVHIGDGTRVGPFVIIMDSNFHGAAGDQSVQHDCLPVMIGKGCRIGSRVTITRGATIGDGAEILAGSVVSSDIPPGVCAAGVRARIIGSANDLASRWESPAALLPDLLMASLGLSSPPDLDSSPIPAHAWTEGGIQTVLDAIEERFGARPDGVAVGEIKTWFDFANAVQLAVRLQQPRSGGRALPE